MRYELFKKAIRYSFKFLSKGKFKDVYFIIKNVEWEHRRCALAARLDRRPSFVKFKESPVEHEINQFLDLIPYRKERITEDIYLWNFGEKKICCNYLQLQGIREEYFKGLFEEIYQYDWENKSVIDIGGFVGDTALFFLDKGAKNVAVYEPVLRNFQALKCNIKGLENRIECHQQALAAADKPIVIFSNEAEGSSGFGLIEGKYRIETSGISMASILSRHSTADAIKMDCEGGEKHLLDLSTEMIRSIPYWIVETHSKELYREITRKFSESGFSVVYEKALNDEVDLLHFKKY